jgi:hypothetical protein
MSTLTLNLSDHAKDAAERRAVENGFDSLQDYIEGLVEQDAAVGEELEKLLSDRAAAPDVGEMRPSDFDAIRERIRISAKARSR